MEMLIYLVIFILAVILLGAVWFLVYEGRLSFHDRLGAFVRGGWGFENHNEAFMIVFIGRKRVRIIDESCLRAPELWPKRVGDLVFTSETSEEDVYLACFPPQSNKERALEILQGLGFTYASHHVLAAVAPGMKFMGRWLDVRAATAMSEYYLRVDVLGHASLHTLGPTSSALSGWYVVVREHPAASPN